MSAIYVMAGEERVGPFSTLEVQEKVDAGIFTPEHLGWMEGMEDWCPLQQLLTSAADSEEDAVADSEVLLEGPGYLLTPLTLQIGEELFPLDILSHAEVEIEHTKRGKPIAGCIVFGVLVILTLAMPMRPETTNHWMIWAVSLTVFVLLLIRSLFSAFKASPAFVAVHLTNGDDRILPMTPKAAKGAAQAVNAAIQQIRQTG
jgi:hypothetical protein